MHIAKRYSSQARRTLAVLLVPHGRVHCENVDPAFQSGIECHIQTAQVASSNTVLRPFCMRAEHSKYLMAPISLTIAMPCEYWIGAMSLNTRCGEFMCHRLTNDASDECAICHLSLSFSIGPCLGLHKDPVSYPRS